MSHSPALSSLTPPKLPRDPSVCTTISSSEPKALPCVPHILLLPGTPPSSISLNPTSPYPEEEKKTNDGPGQEVKEQLYTLSSILGALAPSLWLKCYPSSEAASKITFLGTVPNSLVDCPYTVNLQNRLEERIPTWFSLKVHQPFLPPPPDSSK